jgi:hypothetical protein
MVSDLSDGNKQIDIVGSTDAYRVTIYRKEHKQLVDAWFKGRLPGSLLVLAHIKKRAAANEKERIDPNIGVPMCKLGCDALFELGWIGVNNGKIVSLLGPVARKEVREAVQIRVGRETPYYKEANKPYFQWHWDKYTTPVR